ncbi:MAG: hypothetical protein IJD88_02565 [Clostridia bacterium]|nr:hypothetical protein [Clostridia bacterium]
MKKVIVINGAGGVGKDTICDIVAENYKVKNISTITPIKEIAKQFGWSGAKDDRDRKFLSDLKNAFSDYNDLPNKYAVEEYQKFLNDDNEVMFVHIREGEQIQHFVDSINGDCVTLLIRGRGKEYYGNRSDDMVNDFDYDFTYDNIKSLDELHDDFMAFFNKYIFA